MLALLLGLLCPGTALAYYSQTYTMVGGNPLHTSNVPIAPGAGNNVLLWDNAGVFNRSSPHLGRLAGPARAEMLHQPIIDEHGVVYAGFNRTLMAFDSDTGLPVWSWPNKAYSTLNEIVGSPAKC